MCQRKCWSANVFRFSSITCILTKFYTFKRSVGGFREVTEYEGKQKLTIHQKSLVQMLAMICHCKICNISMSARQFHPIFHWSTVRTPAYVYLHTYFLWEKYTPLSFPQRSSVYIALILMAAKATVKICGVHNI